MHTSRPLIALGATAAVVAGVVVGGTAAGATTYRAFFGYAGGSQVRAADATISSDLSVQSTVFTVDSNASDTKHTAKLTVPGILNTAAVSTSSVTASVSGGRRTTSTARTAGVNLLGGAITVDALTTTSTSSQVGKTFSSTAKSSFAGIHIAGVNLPVTIPANYTVGIPGIATITLNYGQTGTVGTTTASYGAGLVITLLKSQGSSPAGSTVLLNPTYTTISAGDVPATGHAISGNAFGTSVSVKATNVASITSDPTAASTVPLPGTSGKTLTTSVAGVHVATVLTAGAVSTTAKGTNSTALADSITTSRLAGLSLLGGVISAKVITASAHARAVTGKKTTLSGSSSLAGLTIAGKSIPLTVKPNTTLSLGSLGKVVVNEQTKSGGTVTVRALHITLSTAAYGLAAGAQITVGYATASAA